MHVGLLGILKAGGAYVPLDPAYPRDRLTLMRENSQLKLLLSEKKLIAELPKCTANCLAPTTSNLRLDFFALL
jgi:non-ribosomal peptide synthetase component F